MGKAITDMKMWRTPDAVSGGSNLPGIKKALDQGHLKRPSGQQIQIRLHDQVREKRLWPTPRASGAMAEKSSNLKKRVERERVFRSEARGVSGSMANTDSDRKKWNQSEDRQGSRIKQDNWWNIEPDVGRVADGVQGRTHRLKGLGNAIIPQIAEEIGKAILKVDLVDHGSKT